MGADAGAGEVKGEVKGVGRVCWFALFQPGPQRTQLPCVRIGRLVRYVPDSLRAEGSLGMEPALLPRLEMMGR